MGQPLLLKGHVYGKKRMSSCRHNGTGAYSCLYPLCSMWSSAADCLPYPTDDYHFSGDMLSHAPCPSVSQSTVCMVSSTLPARRRGQVGLTARRVWPGCDCSG